LRWTGLSDERTPIPAAPGEPAVIVMALAAVEAALMFAALFVLLGRAVANPGLVAGAVTGACAVAFYCCDLYDLRVTRSLRTYVPSLLKALGLVVLALALFEVLVPARSLGVSLAHRLLLVALLPLAVRALGYAVIRRRLHARAVAILGEGPLASLLVREIAVRPHLRWAVGLVADTRPGPAGPAVPGPVLGRVDQLDRIVASTPLHRIVVALDDRQRAAIMATLLEARARGIVVEDAVDVYERITGKLAIEALSPASLVFARGFRIARGSAVIGRALSLVVAAVGLVLTAPLLGLIAVAVKLDSPGPVFFRQERIGLHGRRFWLVKFRTMRPVQEEVSAWVRDNADRITRLGRLLRASRLDELPQFVNILRGDMNLVGPRPHPVCNYELFLRAIPYYSLRAAVRPGVTGWAQVRYGYANSLEEETEKMRYDLYYVKHRSFWLDARIIADTLKMLLFEAGVPVAGAPARLAAAAPVGGEPYPTPTERAA
jgi:exopolysaccharide biosynthesis polyprenyl glycosylphosphotransferase